jgi:hypothetical protein
MLGVSPCHHSMARPRLADGRDGLQLWSLAVNILNKQSRTKDKGLSSSLGVGRGANNPSSYKTNSLRKATQSLGPGRILWMNDPSEGIWT